VVVPAFAVGRAQSMLYHLGCLRQAGRVSKLLPIFLDSPMAIDATDIFRRHAADHRLRGDALTMMDGDVRYVRTGTESKALTANPVPKVILSASGMATGGRVLHHLEHYAPDPRNTILFTGFQAGGTRGAAIVAGATEVKMHGVHVPIRAEVINMPMLSAHADQTELVRWASAMHQAPRQTFIVHGEPQSADTLRQQLQERLGWTCTVAEHLQTFTLA
jgi:metallo-beta-lactamase family protein